MGVFFNNLKTFINNLEPILKLLIIGMLLIIDILCVMQIVKTHYNPKKFVLKIGQFVLLAIFLLITIFVFAHV